MDKCYRVDRRAELPLLFAVGGDWMAREHEDEKAAIDAAANAIADEYNARVIAYTGRIDSPDVGNLFTQCYREGNKRENTFFILTTVGGDANAAYRIARYFQLTSKRFYLFVPRICKSAGTLVALGADEIVMSPFAELGPLDVQLVQRDEIGQIRSGLVVDTALKGLTEKTLAMFETVMLNLTFRSDKSISFETASKVAASLTTGTMSAIYSQIKPADLGDDLRNLRVANAYGERLVRYRGNATLDTVAHLVHEYPSHDFFIDAEEAKTLFRNVSDQPTPDMMMLSGSLSKEPDKTPAYVDRLDQDSKEESSDQTDASGKPDEPAGGKGEPSSAESRTVRRTPRKDNRRGNRDDATEASSTGSPSGSR